MMSHRDKAENALNAAGLFKSTDMQSMCGDSKTDTLLEALTHAVLALVDVQVSK